MMGGAWQCLVCGTVVKDNDPNARCDCGDPQPHPVDRFDVSAFVEEIDRLRAEVERYKAIERVAKRIKRNARKYRAFRYITHSIAQDIWCIVPREDIICLKEAVAALPAAADPATEGTNE